MTKMKRLYLEKVVSHERNPGMEIWPKALLALYRKGFCSLSKVAPAQCKQEYVHR